MHQTSPQIINEAIGSLINICGLVFRPNRRHVGNTETVVSSQETIIMRIQ